MTINNFYQKLANSKLTILAIVFAIALLSTNDVFAADGDLDATFDGDGKVSTDFGTSLEQINDAVQQPDGKIVVVGITDRGSTNSLALARYNTNGSLDATFGTGGKVLINSSPGGQFIGESTGIALQPDGKIVVALNTARAAARFTQNGALDTTFGTGGYVTLPSNSNILITAISDIAVLADGKILLAGGGFNFSQSPPSRGFGLVRLNQDGSFDTSFGTGGFAVAAIPNSISAIAFKIALRADGKIALAGTSSLSSGNQQSFVVVCNADGSLDASIGTGGRILIEPSGGTLTLKSVLWQTDGKIIVGGSVIGGNFNFRVGLFRRYTTAGASDASFGTNGEAVTTVLAIINDIALQSDGKILGFGYGIGSGRQRFTVLRRLTNGAPDTAFGTNGQVLTSFNDNVDERSEAFVGFVQSDGKIVAAGLERTSSAGGDGNFAIARYLNALGNPTVVNPTLRFADFDGDGKSDISVFRNGNWFINPSSNPSGFAPDSPNAFYGVQFGQQGNITVPADYDGDGKADIAVWRGGAFAYFYILNSSNNTFRSEQFGTSGDNPTVSGDWDADGKADLAVYRGGSQSFFYYRPSSQTGVNFNQIQWGTSGDTPIFGDFDGDRKLDAAVYRPSNNTFYVRQSSNSQIIVKQWGNANTDAIFAGDFDGDGKSDFAVQRFTGADAGFWYIAQSGGTNRAFQWGTGTDLPVPADFDGDGKMDFAVFRRANGTWYIFQSQTNDSRATTFGASNDFPLPLNLVR